MSLEKPNHSPHIKEAPLPRTTQEQLKEALNPWHDAKMLAEQEKMQKPNFLQEFLANFRAMLRGEDIYAGVTIQDTGDIERVQRIFSSIFDFTNSSIELRAGDTLVYDVGSGAINIFPRDTEKGKSVTPSGIIPITKPTNPPWQDRDDAPENVDKTMAWRLGNFVTRNGPQQTGANSCGRSVHEHLKAWGMKNAPRGNGNQWYTLMKHDKRFEEVRVNSIKDIPPGGIVCYSGKGNLGSDMNRQYGHVEIKGTNEMFYSFYASANAGGSAKSPKNQKENFSAWKADTGFVGVFVPKTKT